MLKRTVIARTKSISELSCWLQVF